MCQWLWKLFYISESQWSFVFRITKKCWHLQTLKKKCWLLQTLKKKCWHGCGDEHHYAVKIVYHTVSGIVVGKYWAVEESAEMGHERHHLPNIDGIAMATMRCKTTREWQPLRCQQFMHSWLFTVTFSTRHNRKGTAALLIVHCGILNTA